MNVLIKKFAKDILDKYDDKVYKMILFGSYARGDAKEDSDIDVLVVWKGKRSEGAEKIEDIVYEYLLNQGLYFSLKVIDLEQYNKLKVSASPFIENILKEGVILA